MRYATVMCTLLLMCGCAGPSGLVLGLGSVAADSRVVAVEIPCRADEITIDKNSVKAISDDDIHLPRTTWQPAIDAAKEKCKKRLVNKMWNKAKEECQKYSKGENPANNCDAYRGSFNPDKDTKYSKPVNLDNDAFYHIQCWNNRDVDYSCN